VGEGFGSGQAGVDLQVVVVQVLLVPKLEALVLEASLREGSLRPRTRLASHSEISIHVGGKLQRR